MQQSECQECMDVWMVGSSFTSIDKGVRCEKETTCEEVPVHVALHTMHSGPDCNQYLLPPGPCCLWAGLRGNLAAQLIDVKRPAVPLCCASIRMPSPQVASQGKHHVRSAHSRGAKPGQQQLTPTTPIAESAWQCNVNLKCEGA